LYVSLSLNIFFLLRLDKITQIIMLMMMMLLFLLM